MSSHKGADKNESPNRAPSENSEPHIESNMDRPADIYGLAEAGRGNQVMDISGVNSQNITDVNMVTETNNISATNINSLINL